MRFDFVVGNPPYQGPKSKAGKGSRKLYIPIAKKMISLSDEIAFITPRPILMQSGMNTTFPYFYDTLKWAVSADEYFSESTNAIAFISKKGYKGKISYNDKEITNSYEIYSENAKDFWPIYTKISIRYNSLPKLKIKPSHEKGGVGIRACHLGEVGKFRVLHQSNGEGPAGRKIKFTNREFPKIRKIVIPYSSKFFAPFITDCHLSEFFGVITAEMYPEEQWDNIISYLNTPIIKFFLEEQAKMKGNAYFNGLWQLPALDFSVSWTNNSVKKIFGIS